MIRTCSFDMPCLFFRTITRDDLVEYVSKHYSAPRMVLAAAGGKFSLHVLLFTSEIAAIAL